VAREDTVALADAVAGTHQGELKVHPAAGRAGTFRHVQAGRYEDGLPGSDQPDLLTQHGLDPL